MLHTRRGFGWVDRGPRSRGPDGLTLGADLAVPGDYEPVRLPDPAAVAQVAGGYEVTLNGELMPGRCRKPLARR